MSIDEFSNYLEIGLLVAVVIILIGMAGCFKKAGESWWKAFIPFYNIFVLCDLIGVSYVWIFVFFVVLNPFSFIFLSLIMGASYLLLLYFFILMNVSVAKSFGKSTLYAVGLFFLAPVFWLMLGFSKSTKYAGVKPMNDIFAGIGSKNKNGNNVSNNTGNNIGNNSVVNNVKNEKNFCKYCGSKISSDARYCSNCGQDIQ